MIGGGVGARRPLGVSERAADELAEGQRTKSH